MRKVFAFAAVFVLLFCANAFADQVLATTKTADAQISAKPISFYGVVVMPDGTNDLTVAFYDNTAGSGTHLIPTITFAGDGGAQAFTLPYAIRTNTGLYIDITTTGTAEYTILYGW